MPGRYAIRTMWQELCFPDYTIAFFWEMTVSIRKFAVRLTFLFVPRHRMAAVCSEGLEGIDARIANTFGRAIGHWIYLIDAADDYRKDLASGSFNPFVRLFGDGMTQENAESIAVSLKRYLADAESAFLLIDNFPAPEVREILCNILYLGLPRVADRILEQAWKGEIDKHEKSV